MDLAIARIAEGLGLQLALPGAQNHPTLGRQLALGTRIRQLARLDLPLALHKSRRLPEGLQQCCTAVLLYLCSPQFGFLFSVADCAPRHQSLLFRIHRDFVSRKLRQRVGSLDPSADIEAAGLWDERGARPG